MTQKNGITVVTERPDFFLTAAEFAARVGHTPQTVLFAQRRGRFVKNKLRWWQRPGIPDTLLIHEDQELAYRANCRLTKPGPKPGPKPKKVVIPKLPTPIEVTEETFSSGNRDPFSVQDLGLVKLLKEQIETKRRSLELKMAENSLIDYEKAAKLWEASAIKIRQAILATIPRLASRVASESDVHRCNEILTRELTEALIELSRTEYEDAT